MNNKIDIEDTRLTLSWVSFIVGVNFILLMNALMQGWGWMIFVPLLGLSLGIAGVAINFYKMFIEENEENENTEEEIMQKHGVDSVG